MVSLRPAQGVFRVAVLAATLLLIGAAESRAQPAGGVADDVIQGTVRSANGPEAGVWVIAETTELPTKFVKIVVTDDRGSYVLPQLPKANYDIWVRGYGLVDSPRTKAAPGSALDLKAVLAANDGEAAQYYRRNIGIRCWRFRRRGCFPAPAQAAMACRPN